MTTAAAGSYFVMLSWPFVVLYLKANSCLTHIMKVRHLKGG